MDPVSVEITIARPREEVFEYLADIANHAEFTDHFMVDWRLTREDTYGYGAGARFRLKMPFNRFPWGDTTVIEFERPRRIVEAGRGGKFNRIRTLGVYDLEQGVGGHDARELHAADRAQDPHRQLPRVLRRPRLDEAQAQEVDAPPARHPRGGPRPRRAAVDRRRAAQAVRPDRRSTDRIRRRSCPGASSCSCSSPSPPSPSAPAATRRRSPSTATTEGIYLDVGDLKYQVQISRQLNPTDREDSGYLVDLPADQQLGPDENWFAVFMRVENDTDKAEPADQRYSIMDTQGNVFQPIAMGPKNIFAYRAGRAAAQGRPAAARAAPAAENTIQGALLLFKIPVRQLREPPARARDPAARAATARRAPSTSTSSASRSAAARRVGIGEPRGRPRDRSARRLQAASDARAAGAAVSPPAPEPTSSTPTATCGRPVPAGA